MLKQAYEVQAPNDSARAIAPNFWREHKALFQLLLATACLLCCHLLWLQVGASADAPTLRAMQPLHTFLPNRDSTILYAPNIGTSAGASTSLEHSAFNLKKNGLKKISGTNVKTTSDKSSQITLKQGLGATLQPFTISLYDPRSSLARDDALARLLTNLAGAQNAHRPKALADTIAHMQNNGAIFQTHEISKSTQTNIAIGPSPAGVFFKITQGNTELDPKHTNKNPQLGLSHISRPHTLIVQAPLASTFHLFEMTPQGPENSAFNKAEQTRFNRNSLSLNLMGGTAVGKTFIGYLETDYPTHLFFETRSEHSSDTATKQTSSLQAQNPLTDKITAVIATLQLQLPVLVSVLLALALIALTFIIRTEFLPTRKSTNQNDGHSTNANAACHTPWLSLFSLAAIALISAILTTTHLSTWPKDPIPCLLIGVTILWSILRAAYHRVAGNSAKRLWAGPLLVIVILACTYFAPTTDFATAHGPLLLIAMSILLCHSAILQVLWPIPKTFIDSPSSRILWWSITRCLPALGLALAGLTFVCWVLLPANIASFPDTNFLQADGPWHWLSITFALCGIGHIVSIHQLVQHHKRARAADLINQANIKDMNRTILTQLSQQLTAPEQNVGRARASNMRSDEKTPSRVNLSTIGESQQSPFEKVAEYADISALLDEEAKWVRAPLNIAEWIEKNAKAWTQRVNRHNLQLIISIKPNTPITIDADAEKLSHMIQSFLDISTSNAQTGNIILRLDATETESGGLLYRLSIQDTGSTLPDNLTKLLKTNWLELIAKPFDQTHVKYARILLAHRWLYLAQGKLTLAHDPMSGTRYQITFKTKVQNTPPALTEAKAENDRIASTLLMSYDAEYATTMAEQANFQNNPMSLALSTKQAMRNLRQAQNATRSFEALIVDFSRDAESLQGFIFELKEQPEYEHTPIILLTHPHQRVDYLTQIMRAVYAIPRPSYYQHLSTAVNSFVFQSNPNFKNALKNASHQLTLPNLSDLQKS